MRVFTILYIVFCIGIAVSAQSQPFPSLKELPVHKELPDPFTMMDGTKIKTQNDWYEKRRPELKQLFQHYMYGYAPPPPGITFKVTNVVTDMLNGKATLKEIDIYINGLHDDDVPVIQLALFIPNNAEKPAPVFLGINKCGNYTVLPDPRITISPHIWTHSQCPPADSRGTRLDFWCVEYLIDRGYAFATFHESTIDPDKPDFTDGIHPFYHDVPGPEKSKWGTIAAWAWGFQRCVDYLVNDDDINKERIAVIGHSRRGKAALLAAAMDERIAMVVPHQSGTGGAALSRENHQETIERINRVFPHWFNDHFTEFNDQEEKLPIDQHLLMALVAPRLLLDTAGLKDTWANYENALLSLQAASRVYEFLDAGGLKGDGIASGMDVISAYQPGKLLQYRLDTAHTLNQDYWQGILDFADYHYNQ